MGVHPGKTSTLFSEFGFPWFFVYIIFICFMHSPWGVMYNQWWSDAPCWRQVGQTARCPGSYDGVHLSGKWPWRVELYCSLTAARSVWEAILQNYRGQSNVLMDNFFLFWCHSLLPPCYQTSALWMACIMRWTRNFPSAMTKATWWTAPAMDRDVGGGSAMPSVRSLLKSPDVMMNSQCSNSMGNGRWPAFFSAVLYQISVRSHKRKPSIRLETPGTKSSITFTTDVIALAMGLERWGVNLSEPTKVRGKLLPA